MFGFMTGFVFVVAVLIWLYRSKQSDVAACATTMGLVRVSDRVERRGETPEGLAFYDLLRAKGTVSGWGAEVWERTVRRPVDVKYRKSRGSILTRLELTPALPPTARFRLQPAGAMELVEDLMKGTPTAHATGDAAFDQAFKLYAEDAASALAVLTPALRHDIMAFRRSVAGDLPASRAGNLAAGTVLGSFVIAADRVSWDAFGTPSGKIGAHLRQAAPLLVRLAGAEPR
jgi:hypothetical protein